MESRSLKSWHENSVIDKHWSFLVVIEPLSSLLSFNPRRGGFHLALSRFLWIAIHDFEEATQLALRERPQLHIQPERPEEISHVPLYRFDQQREQ